MNFKNIYDAICAYDEIKEEKQLEKHIKNMKKNNVGFEIETFSSRFIIDAEENNELIKNCPYIEFFFRVESKNELYDDLGNINCIIFKGHGKYNVMEITSKLLLEETPHFYLSNSDNKYEVFKFKLKDDEKHIYPVLKKDIKKICDFIMQFDKKNKLKYLLKKEEIFKDEINYK